MLLLLPFILSFSTTLVIMILIVGAIQSFFWKKSGPVVAQVPAASNSGVATGGAA